MTFDVKGFCERLQELIQRGLGELKLDHTFKELCPVDILEAGHYLEASQLKDADHVFDLTVDELSCMMQAA